MSENIENVDDPPTSLVPRRNTENDDQRAYLIQSSEIKRTHKLGNGAFGQVWKAIWQKTDDHVIDVAVKELIEVTNVSKALEEIKCMQRLRHPNVVRLYGIIINSSVQMVVELCEDGSLEDRLKDYDKPKLLVSKLLDYAKQLSTGMVYLESMKCIHRDLATRNILLCNKENTLKISDFGLTIFLKKDETYYRVNKSDEGFPYRWYPLEAIYSKMFTHKADVWSYAMTLFEIFTYGTIPWPHRQNFFAIIADLELDTKHKKPDYVDGEIYDLMCACWAKQWKDRPSFGQLEATLAKKEFAMGKCITPQKSDHAHQNLLIVQTGEELIIVYEKDTDYYFAQNTKTGQYGLVHNKNIEMTTETPICKEYLIHSSAVQTTNSNSASANTANRSSKKDDKNYERAQFQVCKSGKTSLYFVLDGVSFVMFPQKTDLVQLQKWNEINCCIGSPDQEVIIDINRRLPYIEWVAIDEPTVKLIKGIITYKKRVHLSKSNTTLKLSIKSKNFKIHQTKSGFIIKGPISKLIYLYPHDLYDETKKLIKNEKSFDIAVFCINSLKNEELPKLLETFRLVNAEKMSLLMFTQEKPVDLILSFLNWLHRIKKEKLMVLEKGNEVTHHYGKFKGTGNILTTYIKKFKKEKDEPDTQSTSLSIATVSTSTTNTVK